MRSLLAISCSLLLEISSILAQDSANRPRPTVSEFLGVCGHTVQFKPALYKPAVRLVRDYHPVDWDTGPDPATPTEFPFAKNRVHWETVYGSWKKEGFDTNVCLMFDMFKPEAWKNPAADSERYGEAFAKALGPTSKLPFVSSAEIGNEPGTYSDEQYRRIFEGMAKGLRKGDPKLKIATCNMVVGKSHRYAKSVDCIKGLESLYDVLTTHTYAEAEPWPTWRRSYPEDPSIKYLKEVAALMKWRDANAPGKPIWVTEFGWDASTKLPPPTGDFAKWQGNTEEQQAYWLVRSVLLFMEMGVDRAYVYFFNDDDAPQLHGSSGLTRKFVPKPAFYALEHLQRVLGGYRFNRVVGRDREANVYEFINRNEPRDIVWVGWTPGNGGDRIKVRTDTLLEGLTVVRAERTPLSKALAEQVQINVVDGAAQLFVSEAPLFVRLRKP
jgi:hypothetical protein